MIVVLSEVKDLKVYYFVIFLFLFIFPSVAFAGQDKASPFVVVELFSSEGCSSCPAADILVSKIIVWARQNNEPVYPLVFHVDYWNHLGWRDIFSRAEFTQRQHQYARIFKDQGMYTPQMIINGNDAFIGSDQERLQESLDRELAAMPSGDLEINVERQKAQVVVTYKAQGFETGSVINIAMVERDLSTQVTAGENAGRTLRHDNIVREFQVLPLTEDPSEVKFALRRIKDPAQVSIIAYVQHPATMLIVAAKQVDLVS